ncbi:hypothetical protein P7C73_g3384, partial [Tremellales sp. Uapishka_1]
MPSTSNPKRVVIIGGGISGIAQAIRLKEALKDKVQITILEKASAPGGIWRDSTWPGADLWSKFLFNTEYTASEWSHQAQFHTVHATNVLSGAEIDLTADILISANGPLSKPLIPRLPGIDNFKGVSFHNLKWDSSVNFEGKRVAVIGNGSSGIQFIPGLAAIPGVKLTQFIRSGGFFFPKINPEYTTLQKFAYRWVPGLLSYNRLQLFRAHNDRWNARSYEDGQGHDSLELDLLKYLSDNAPPEYLEALTPKYPLGCKRPAFDAGWLASLHRPNVHLTNSPITEITAGGIVTGDGVETKVDIIIYATGSDVAKHGVGVNVGLKGEDGLELRQYWEELNGPQAYLGLAVPKFPNYFMVLGPNAIAGSWGWTIGNQTAVIARIVKEMSDYGLSSIQPDESVFHARNSEIQARLGQSTMASNQCTSWWRITDGKITVPNSLSAAQSWAATRTTHWAEWVAVAFSPSSGGEKPQLRRVDVAQKEKLRQLTTAVSVASAIASLVALYNYRDSVPSLLRAYL